MRGNVPILMICCGGAVVRTNVETSAVVCVAVAVGNTVSALVVSSVDGECVVNVVVLG